MTILVWSEPEKPKRICYNRRTCIRMFDSELGDNPDSMSSVDEDMLEFQADLRRIGEGYVIFTICCLGVIGNTLAFVTFSTKGIRNTTTSVYLRSLAIVDICVLITAVFRYKTYKMFLSDTDELNTAFHVDAYIEVYVEPLHWIALGSSSFITITLSLERYLAVKYPLTIKRRCNVKTVLFCVISVIFFSVVLTIPNFLSYEIIHFNFFAMSIAVATLTDFGEMSHYPCVYHNYLVPILWYIVPAVFLSVINILLSIHVQRSTRIRVGLPHVKNPNRNVTIMIIVIISVYIGCNFPKCIFMFYKLVTEVSDMDECTDTTNISDSHNTKAYLVCEVITDLLNVLNSCMNFCVYCLVGSRFREQLTRVITCKIGRKHDIRRLGTINHSSTLHRTNTSSRY